MQFYQQEFSALPTIRTQRLLLRPLRMQDDKDMFRYCSDPAVSRHVLWDTHPNVRYSRSCLRPAIRQYRAGQPATFGIERLEDQRLIGTIGFIWVNTDHRSAEIGYSLARDCWNQGYATEALKAALKYGFDKLRLNRIEAQHESDNPASGRVMEKAGMRYEGTLRGRVFNKGRFSDVMLYARLRTDVLDRDGNKV